MAGAREDIAGPSYPSLQWKYPINVHVTLPHFFLPVAMVSRDETREEVKDRSSSVSELRRGRYLALIVRNT